MVTATKERTETPDPQPLRLKARSRTWRAGLLAAALMAAGAALSVVALEQVDQRSPVLVAAEDLPAGHQVGANDVRVVEAAGLEGVSTLGEAQQAVGATLTTPVTEGALVSQEVLGSEGEQLGSDEATVGLQLEPGRVPSSARAGAQVSIVLTGEGADQSIPARVQTLEGLTDEAGGGGVSVDLVVETTYAAQVARAAAAEEVSLVHTAQAGEAP